MARQRGSAALSLSLGYDRIRFLAPVYLGDTIHLQCTVSALDTARGRTSAAIKVSNQKGELVAVATHLIKWVEPPA